MTTTEPLAASWNPADLVGPVHSLVGHQLGLPSPLGKAVGMLETAAKLSFNSTGGAAAARRKRADLALSIARGERVFDDAAVREFDKGSVWISVDDDVT